MAVSKERWRKADTNERKRILKVYYPEIIGQIRQEAMGVRVHTSIFSKGTEDKNLNERVKAFAARMKR